MSRTIQPGECVFTVSAYFISVDESEPRALLRYHEQLGYWVQPGDRIEYGMDPITSLVAVYEREVGIDLWPYFSKREERNGVQVLPLPSHMAAIRIPAGKMNPEEPEHILIDLGYLIQGPRISVRHGVQAKWVSYDELDEYLIPQDVRAFLQEHL